MKMKQTRSSSRPSTLGAGPKTFIISVVAVALVALGATALVPTTANAADVTVYKDPNCGCCTKWVRYLRSAGHKVTVHNRANVDPIKDAKGVPRNFRSCHTAEVDGYVIEGHVPLEDIATLLRDRPPVRGLVVPGMPLGSPGMEVPGRRPMPYKVFSINKDGAVSVYAEH